ncbi:uncharacterized protein [Haliotis asinina]|uniref:uncharacterized protein n=1 Tax=Haliotis asinina TaxID=109174 RepID=UPI00353198EF
MSWNLELRRADDNVIEMDGLNLDTDHLPGATGTRVQQIDIQSVNMATVKDCSEGIGTSAANTSDPLNTFSHVEANMERLTSGDGMPAAKHGDGTEVTRHRPSTSCSRFTVSSAVRSSDAIKYSGWFHCSDCGQKVRGKAQLRSHMKLLHKSFMKTKTVVTRNTSRFKGGERVKGKKSLSQHGFSAHKGQTRIRNMAKTMKICSSIPPCSAVFADSTSQCSSSVVKSNTEIKHLRLGPWFTCQSCDHIFKGRSQLQEHVRLKHQGFNEAREIKPSMPEITHFAKSEQCKGSVDSIVSDEAMPHLSPECPVENQDVESVVSSNQIWHQCDLCGLKVEGRKKLQRHYSKCKGEKQITTPTVMALQTSLSAYEANDTKNRSWYKCKHCCRHFRGRKRFLQHIRLCVKAPQDSVALWQRISHLKQCSWYRCSGCQYTFKGKKRIQLHTLECQSCPSAETDRQSFEKKSDHTCTLCHKHFQRRLFLDKHMRRCQSQQRKTNLSEQGSVDVQSSEHRLVQEQGKICEEGDDIAPKGQTIEGNDELGTLSDHQPCSKTQVYGDAMSQLSLVFLQDGSWYKCEICGQNLRGKEQIKKHSHEQNSKETDTGELVSLNTSCLESEFLTVGSWHRCKICGKNLRGKEQLKNHSHAHEIKKSEEQEIHIVTGLESNFLRVGTWHRCKTCGENLRGKEQVKNHSHDLKVVNPDDEKTVCPDPSPPCLDFVKVGTWYSCKVCGQKLQGRKQMQLHSHSQPVDKTVPGNGLGLGTEIQNGLRSVEDGFIQVGSWYRCKSCLVRFRGRHNAEVHHRLKCSLGEGGYCHEDLLPEHCSAPRQGQDGVLRHDVQPTAMTDDVQHDMHPPKSDVQNHGGNEQYGCVDLTVSTMVPANVTVRDYIIKTEKGWECRICSKMILSWIGAFKHVRSHFTGTSLDCRICNKSFSSSGNRRKHERIHDTGNGSSVLKKHCHKKSLSSGPHPMKTMNHSYLTSMNRQQLSIPASAAACSQKTNIQRPNIAVERENKVQKELTFKSCSPEASAGAPMGDASATSASVAGASVTSASVAGVFVEAADVDNASKVYVAADAHTEAATLPCYGTSENNKGKFHKDQGFIRSGRRDKCMTDVYVDNDTMCADNESGTGVSLDQTYLSNDVLSSDDKMISELCDTSENERLSVEDEHHDDYVLFSEYEEDKGNLCIAELYEEQQSQVMSDVAEAPTETECTKLCQTSINVSEMSQAKQKLDNSNQESTENESMNIRDSNVSLSDINKLSRTLLERSDTDSREDEELSESGYTKFAVVQDCSLDTDLIMSDVSRHPDLVWSDDEFMPQTDIYSDSSMVYDPHSQKEEALNVSRRRITQDNSTRSQKPQICSELLHERFDIMDSARAERKNFLNSKLGKNRIAASTKCRMKTVCKPKQSWDMFNFQLMPSDVSERWRKRKQDAANECAGEISDKQISDDLRTHEDHSHKDIFECSRSSGQIDLSSSEVNRKKPMLYKTRKELYVPEQVRFQRGQEEKTHFKDYLDNGDSMCKGVRRMSLKACDRPADRDEKSRQGRFVCSLCYKTFASETVATGHLKQHARNQKNRARNYSKKTIINVGFKKHCRVCQRVFTNEGDLELHECRHLVEDTVGPSKYVRCEICGERYRTQKLLDQHKIGHQVWLKCSHCNLYFAKVTELQQHCVVAKHFVCECGDAFTSYAKLDIHRDGCMCIN